MSNSSKNEFPEDATNNLRQKSPIEFIADAFWEDFEAQRPINGGVLCEDKLHQCQLDGSILSLRCLDDLLDELRLQWSGKETLFIQDERNRNLLLFIGFYMGRILAKSWHTAPQWLSQHEVATHYPHLKVRQENAYHFMALNYLPSEHQVRHESRHLFFVLEPIGNRLFPQSKQLAVAVQAEDIDKGVFDAVFRRLPLKTKEALLDQIPIKPKQSKTQTLSAKPQPSSEAVSQLAVDENIQSVNKKSITQSGATNIVADADNIASEIKTNTDDPDKVKSRTVPSLAKKLEIKRQDDFTNLRNDLHNIKIEQQEGDTLYIQADKVLSQFDRHIAKLNQKGKTTDQITFSEQHQRARRQALANLSKAAKLGNTDAMLRLAIAYFLGEGVDQNTEKGVTLVQKAAKADDSRAQRQLSRLYYQGLGVSQDTEQGRQWLEMAADNGHEEAKELLEQWYNSQTIIDERKYDATTDRRYLLLIIVAVIVAVVIFIMV